MRHIVKPFEELRAGGYSVTPLVADHSEMGQCLIYAVLDRGKTILHGHDSEWLPNETWDYLESFKPDLAILDCTYGPLPGIEHHKGMNGVLRVKEEMMKRGIANDETIFVVAHFSHNGGLLNEELVDRLEPENVEVAYGGLTVEL